MQKSMPSSMVQLQQHSNTILDTHFQALRVEYKQTTALTNARLIDAMHYSVMNGGKRIRPLLTYAGAQAINKQACQASLDLAAMAIEFIHCYSLVHDDLPAMDDDDLRRGKPTCHKQFDEATAILVGDALQTEAFQLLTRLSVSDSIKIQVINTLSRASSACGLVGGQTLDLEATDQDISLQQLQTIHQLKTGELIACSVKIGAIIAGASAAQLKTLDTFARAIGLAFQVQDDILDLEGCSDALGKTTGVDSALNKATYPRILGLTQAKQLLDTLYQEADQALTDFGDNAAMLNTIANFIIKRNF